MTTMRKPSARQGIADMYAGDGEAIYEISDNNRKGLGALMSVRYLDSGKAPELVIELYRIDDGVRIMVEGHDEVIRRSR